MTDLNTIAFTGRAIKDAERTSSRNGDPIARFTVANNYYKKGAKNDTDASFIDCVMIGKRADVAKYIKKGSQIAVTGELRQNHWVTDGQKQSRWEVVVGSVQLLGSKPESKGPESFESSEFDDDDIAF